MTIALAPPATLDHRILTGPEKVATLLLFMGKTLASQLLKHFDPAELKLVTRAAAALGPVPVQSVEGLVEELAAGFSRGSDLQGTASDIEQMLGGVLPPEQVADIMADVNGNSNSSTWVKLSALPEKDLAAYLAKEHPQSAALILSRLTPEASAKTLAVFDRDMRANLIRRLLSLRPVGDPAIRILETKLRDDLLASAGNKSEGNVAGRVADILNRMDPEEAEAMLEQLAASKPAEVAVLRSKMMSFSEVANLSAKARSVLLEKVPSETIVFALKGTEAEFRDALLSAMGARARRLVENELNNGAGSAKEVTQARQAITATVLDLIARGEIEPPEPAAAA